MECLSFEVLPNGDAYAEYADPATGEVYGQYLPDYVDLSPERVEPEPGPPIEPFDMDCEFPF